MNRCFTGATVLDPSSETIIDAATVIVKDGRIQAVGAPQHTPLPDGTDVIDLSGKFVIPGLIDCHIHDLQRHGIFRWDVPGGRRRG